MTRPFASDLRKLWCALLLAMLALHAAPHGPLPHVPDRGSAVSASSVEVALAPGRAGYAAAQTTAPRPEPLHPPAKLPDLVQVEWSALARATWSANNPVRAPPAEPPRTRQPDPRAPPLSA